MAKVKNELETTDEQKEGFGKNLTRQQKDDLGDGFVGIVKKRKQKSKKK